MKTKISNNIQLAKSKSHVGLLKLFTVLYLLHKRLPNSNKCNSVVHKIKNKDKGTSKSKKMNKKKYLNATGLEPTSFEC